MSNFENLCNEYRENKRLIEELESMNEGIIAIMGDRESVTEGASKASYKTVTSSRLDSKNLKKDLPDIFTRYSLQTSYKRFTVI